jgi:hypothetical protein
VGDGRGAAPGTVAVAPRNGVTVTVTVTAAAGRLCAARMRGGRRASRALARPLDPA